MLTDRHGDQPRDGAWRKHRHSGSIGSTAKLGCEAKSIARGLVAVARGTPNQGRLWGAGGCSHPLQPIPRLAGAGPPPQPPTRFLCRQHWLPAPPPVPPQQRGKSQRGAFERAPRHSTSCTSPPTPGPPARPRRSRRLPAALRWERGLTSTAQVGGECREEEPGRAGNGGHASCHRRLGSAPAQPAPAPAPGGGRAPFPPPLPQPGAAPCPAKPCLRQPGLSHAALAGLGLSHKPGTAGTGTGVLMELQWEHAASPWSWCKQVMESAGRGSPIPPCPTGRVQAAAVAPVLQPGLQCCAQSWGMPSLLPGAAE